MPSGNEGTIIVDKPTRAEWIAIASLVLTLAALLFNFGVVYQQVRDHETRLVKQERITDDLIPKVVRIDTNVQFLAEQAREQRMQDNGR
jgi:hypothetical protein